MLIYRTSLNSFHLHIYEKKIKQELVYQAIIINNKVAIKPEELATAIFGDCKFTEFKIKRTPNQRTLMYFPLLSLYMKIKESSIIAILSFGFLNPS